MGNNIQVIQYPNKNRNVFVNDKYKMKNKKKCLEKISISELNIDLILLLSQGVFSSVYDRYGKVFICDTSLCN